MNRDSGPSFSLEFSQLETIKEYEEVVNFIPGSFDYESVEFDENRSKHRNDPHTMKKLRQKYAKKDKKKEIHGSKKRGSNSSPSKNFFVEKKLYRLGGIPQVLNVWMFELCSNVDTKVAVKEGNNIPRILNWRVFAVRPQYNKFMTGMFSKL
ncbi:hypothetical protein BC332_30950 [Capsicum chinense]|nr:hypothetical protein BC332_30950 [Capsicum chinense]